MRIQKQGRFLFPELGPGGTDTGPRSLWRVPDLPGYTYAQRTHQIIHTLLKQQDRRAPVRVSVDVPTHFKFTCVRGDRRWHTHARVPLPACLQLDPASDDDTHTHTVTRIFACCVVVVYSYSPVRAHTDRCIQRTCKAFPSRCSTKSCTRRHLHTILLYELDF